MAGGRSFDHIVLAVRDLDAAAEIYEGLGFTLTPRARHEDRMGTSNRLVQFAESNFIELLEVDRPDVLAPHGFAETPPTFSFGAHNRAAVAEGEGASMLAFATEDARADIAAFESAGLQTYAPFDFERQARLPDGQEATLAFSLAFATSPDMPRTAFFVCQNRAPQYFWKPQFQTHTNGALGLRAIYLASDAPERDAAFLGKLFGGDVTSGADGLRVACGRVQELRVLSPDAIAARDPGFAFPSQGGPVLAGVALACGEGRETTPAAAARGLFIEWSAAGSS